MNRYQSTKRLHKEWDGYIDLTNYVVAKEYRMLCGYTSESVYTWSVPLLKIKNVFLVHKFDIPPSLENAEVVNLCTNLQGLYPYYPYCNMLGINEKWTRELKKMGKIQTDKIANTLFAVIPNTVEAELKKGNCVVFLKKVSHTDAEDYTKIITDHHGLHYGVY